MAPKSRTRSNRKSDAMENRRHLLRVIVTASAACGLVVNIIAIANISRVAYRQRSPKQLMSWAFLPLLGSLAWDIGHLMSKRFAKMHVSLQISGDALAFLGFVAILITNGIVARNLGPRAWIFTNAIMLMAYNSFPWIICAGTHFCLAFFSLFTTLDFHKLPSVKIEWPEARVALLADDDEFDEVVEEAHSKNKGSIDGGDDEESSQLLGSS